MTIQWFPGHMHATRKALAERLPSIDVVVELLDARLPGSSANPLLAELTAGKPALKVLNKQDLADAAITEQWLAHLRERPGTQALALDAKVKAPAQLLVAACRALVPQRGGMVKPVRVLICGIPNVGKSTLINTLVGQRSAKTGDEPGITKTEQRIMLADDFQLYDTPGLLWPRITVPESGLLLAASGSIGRNAYDEVEVASALLGQVQRRYAERLMVRYKLAAETAGLPADALLHDIGRKRGALVAGGRVDLQKAAEVAINDYRAGAWGRITLETPDEFSAWHSAGQAREAQRLAAKRQRAAKPVPQRGASAPSPDPKAAD